MMALIAVMMAVGEVLVQSQVRDNTRQEKEEDEAF